MQTYGNHQISYSHPPNFQQQRTSERYILFYPGVLCSDTLGGSEVFFESSSKTIAIKYRQYFVKNNPVKQFGETSYKHGL